MARRAKGRPLFADYHTEASAFLFEILRVADALRAAKTASGSLAFEGGRRAQVLAAIDRCGGAPAFADLARFLHVSGTAARTFALDAATAGLVELFPSPDDKRSWQVGLTPAGRAAVEARRMPEFGWVFTLLGGLEPSAMRDTERVLRTIRLRLERDARDRRRAGG
jgi:DNA-binding MarR family transcriptional regulator